MSIEYILGNFNSENFSKDDLFDRSRYKIIQYIDSLSRISTNLCYSISDLEKRIDKLEQMEKKIDELEQKIDSLQKNQIHAGGAMIAVGPGGISVGPGGIAVGPGTAFIGGGFKKGTCIFSCGGSFNPGEVCCEGWRPVKEPSDSNDLQN